MTYSIPTNKLRDLIAVLNILDPDIEHGIVEVTILTPNKRIIELGETSEAEVIKDIRESLDLRCEATTAAELVEFIGDILTKKDELEETIRRIKRELEDCNVSTE